MIKWFVDNTLEVVIAYVRAVAICGPTAALVMLGCSIWVPADRWELIASGALLLAVSSFAAYLGFYLFGNEEWRPKRGDAER